MPIKAVDQCVKQCVKVNSKTRKWIYLQCFALFGHENHQWRNVNFSSKVNKNITPRVFFTFFKTYKLYKIVQRVLFAVALIFLMLTLNTYSSLIWFCSSWPWTFSHNVSIKIKVSVINFSSQRTCSKKYYIFTVTRLEFC